MIFRPPLNICLSKSGSVPRLVVILASVCWSLMAQAMPAQLKSKVSHDISRFKAFEIQTEAVKFNHLGGIITIGADVACDFDSAVVSLQTVIDSGATEIRVASNGSYLNNLTIENQSVVIRGGFADCVAADANLQTFDDLTVIDGSANAAPVVYITGTEFVQQVRLENLVLTGGTSVFPKFGGGLSLDLATVNLQLLRVNIYENTGSAGAGIRIDAGQGDNSVDTQVMGREVLILSNESSGFGGGLDCIGSAEIVLTGMSLIGNNQANTGGGVLLRHGCSLSMYSEIYSDSISFLTGIFNNQSLSNGGGAYLFNGAELYLFGQKMCDETACIGSGQIPILVRDNEAGTSLSADGNGGGLYLAQSGNPNLFYANGLLMLENIARENGGGGYLDLNGQVIVERQAGACWNKDRCNLIIGNQSGTNVGFGGAFYVANGGDLKLSQSYLEENRADFGTAISVSGETAIVALEGVVMDDNGDDGGDGFSDFSVVRADSGATVSITHSTFADNNAVGSVFSVDSALSSSLSLMASVVSDSSSGNVFGPVSGTLSIECLVTHEHSSFNGENVVVGLPSFVNRSIGDFHLGSDSPAIDLCAGFSMVYPIDLDAEPRGWDDPNHVNIDGVFDAGADESYVNDVIFKNNFEL